MHEENTFTTDTPIGEARIIAWGDALVVTLAAATVNRVQYRIRADMRRAEGGNFTLNIPQGHLSMDRADGDYTKSWSWAAREKAESILVEAVNAWAAKNPEAVGAGKLATLKSALAAADAKCNELTRKLLDAQDERDRASEALAAFESGSK